MEVNKNGGVTYLNNNSNNDDVCPDLNDDVFWEILQRVSLDTLERCRLASKKIEKYTNLPLFLTPFYARSDIFVGCIFQFMHQRMHCHQFRHHSDFKHAGPNNGPSLSLSFLPEKVKIRACSNMGGLVYCRGSKACYGARRSNYICKPTTKEWVSVVPSNRATTVYETEAYALVVKKTRPLDYSIFRFSKLHWAGLCDENTMFCERYDSRTCSWRRAKDIKFEKITSLVKKESPIYMKGVLHFLTCSQEIFAFDIGTETWELKPLPGQLIKGVGDRLKLGQNRRKLMLFELIYQSEERENMQTWELRDYSRNTWVKGNYSLGPGHATGVAYYSSSRCQVFLTPKSTRLESYASVKADDTNILYFTQSCPPSTRQATDLAVMLCRAYMHHGRARVARLAPDGQLI